MRPPLAAAGAPSPTAAAAPLPGRGPPPPRMAPRAAPPRPAPAAPRAAAAAAGAAAAAAAGAPPAGAPAYTADGLDLVAADPSLAGHEEHLKYRWRQFAATKASIEANEGSLADFALGHRRFGAVRDAARRVTTYREWAPGAAAAALIGDFNGWRPAPLERDAFGVFSIELPDAPDGTPAIPHRSRLKVRLQHPGGWWVDRVPAWARWATAEPGVMGAKFDGVHWDPPPGERHAWRHARPGRPAGSLRIYEAHVGMSAEEGKVASYAEFRDTVLPRVSALGYNAIQLMAIQEHAYYASFGYHVTSPFAVSSRCGTPEDLKSLVDEAHRRGILVLLDVVHSHISSNADDGLAGFDLGQGGGANYFLQGDAGRHAAWDSRLLDYGCYEALRYLLSNVRYWVEDLGFDGFRFDGVTSMLYHHHGIGVGFSGNYNEYFSPATNVDACVYLMLANDLVHNYLPAALRGGGAAGPDAGAAAEGGTLGGSTTAAGVNAAFAALTVAEDVSGMPGLARPVAEGGLGFDARLAMGVPDFWVRLLKHVRDEAWRPTELVAALCNRRYSEATVAYAESHDQALVGDQTVAFRLMGAEMYEGMSALSPPSAVVARGVALHKMIRAVTAALGGEAWLAFMGNEFGHPEWIDFPREGNGWSHQYARRQWSLADAPHLRYAHLQAYDAALMALDGRTRFISDPWQWATLADDGRQVLVAERGPLVWVFNWSPERSYESLPVPVPEPGRYRIALDSDARPYGGEGRLGRPGADHFSAPVPPGDDGAGGDVPLPGARGGRYGDRGQYIRVLAPARTAVAYYKVNEEEEAARAAEGRAMAAAAAAEAAAAAAAAGGAAGGQGGARGGGAAPPARAEGGGV